MVKNPPANVGDSGLIPGSGQSPAEGWQPILVFLPGKSHGQRSLAAYSPWGHKRVSHDLATEQQQNHKYIFTFDCILLILIYFAYIKYLQNTKMWFKIQSCCSKFKTKFQNSNLCKKIFSGKSHLHKYYPIPLLLISRGKFFISFWYIILYFLLRK